MHLKEMEAVKAGMPIVSVRHDGDGGSAAKDVHMENFNVSVGGRDLITDASVTLSFGRHYGELLQMNPDSCSVGVHGALRQAAWKLEYG